VDDDLASRRRLKPPRQDLRDAIGDRARYFVDGAGMPRKNEVDRGR